MLASPLPRIGIIPAYVSYFEELDPDLGRRKAAFARQIFESLTRASTGILEIMSAEMVGTVEDARMAAHRFEEDGVDVLVVMPLIAVFGQLLLAASGSGSIPVLALSVASERTIADSYTMAEMVMQSGGLGLQALCNTLTRRERRFEVCAGTLDSDEFPSKVCRTLQAMAIPKILQKTRLGLIGASFPAMTDVELDLQSAEMRLGIESVEVTSAQLTNAYLNVRTEHVSNALEEYRSLFSIQAISDDELQRSARLALALDRIVETHNIGYGAMNSHGENCLRNPEIGVMATLGVSLLTSRGIPMAEVADAPTAIAMAIGRMLVGCSVYAELDSIDFDSSRWFIANSGELDFAAVDPSQPIVLRGSENFRGIHGRGASFDAVVQPGPATLLSFTPTAGEKYRVVAAGGTVLPERRECFHAVHALFSVPTARQAFEGWCRAGAVHHAALIPGDAIPQLRTLARIWPQVELVVVGE